MVTIENLEVIEKIATVSKVVKPGGVEYTIIFPTYLTLVRIIHDVVKNIVKLQVNIYTISINVGSKKVELTLPIKYNVHEVYTFENNVVTIEVRPNITINRIKICDLEKEVRIIPYVETSIGEEEYG